MNNSNKINNNTFGPQLKKLQLLKQTVKTTKLSKSFVKNELFFKPKTYAAVEEW